ncbi:MAG TPA: TetR/AcrR family transcriptional regulator [Desulfopila sp.]|nr:TetR/AcrR family transcriptional regulator [Desulfopila sp.]
MRDSKKQERQEKILLEALRLFTEKGYFNTSVNDIQASLNLSVGTLYNYFKNKEAIAITLFSNIENCLYEALCEIEKKHLDTAGRCRAIIRHLFDTTERNPDSMQYLFYTKHREFMAVEKSVFASLPFLKMKEMVIRGQQRGELRDMDANVALVAIFAAPMRMISLRIDNILERPLPTYLDESWECAWRSVKAV